MNRFYAFIAATFCAFFVLPECARATPPLYNVLDLGTLDGDSSSASGINASGQVVGQYTPAGSGVGVYQAVRWTGSSSANLGSTLLSSTLTSYAHGINDSGQVVGRVGTGNGFPVRWTGTTPEYLGGSGRFFFNINASGAVAGVAEIGGFLQAARWIGTTPTYLSVPGGDSISGYGINASGQIAGLCLYNTPTARYRAVRWTETTPTILDTLGGRNSYGYGINDSGEVVGAADIPGNIARHAARWKEATPTDLGTLGGTDSVGYSINASGDVLGTSQISGNSAQHAFIYTSGVMYDLFTRILPGSGVTDISIGQVRNSMNDNGQIAATGTIAGKSHAIRLDPVRVAIFIPGIAGSMLTGNGETGANGNGEYLWPTLGAQDIRAMNLNTGAADVQAVGIVRLYDPGLGGIGTKIVYQPLMDFLVNRLGYVEFDFQEHPERITNNYLNQQSWPQKPTLFTFPYDWRKANSSHAVKLRDYIEQISQLHGGAKVDVIAHSMGGLVLRQYLQTYGSAKINKVVTIGTPVWGSPTAVYRMLTGKFYDSPVDWDTSTDMKAALRSMPSTAELIPPFQAGHISGRTTLLSEDHWDLNDEGGANESYSPAVFWKYINGIAPGFQTFNTTLHSALQDNWHGDNSDISYLQVYGQVTESGKPTTTTDVVAFEKVTDYPGGVIRRWSGFRENKGPGDNVVPLESANRPGQYLAPNTELFPVAGNTDDADTNPAEHTELTKNPTVHAKIASFLGVTPTPAPPTPPAPVPPPPSSGSRRSITLFGSGYVPITDASGNQNTRLTDAAIKKIPGLNIQYHAEEGWVEIEGDASREFTITNPAMTGELEAQIVTYNAAGTADSLTRYRFAPSAQGWRLSAPSGASQLAVDANRNGVFEAGEAVTPSHQVTGAVDMTPPSLTMTLGLQAGALSVTMAGSDNAGNPVIRYTINGGPVLLYSAPLTFTRDQQTELKAFAEDTTGNSTGLIQTAVNPRLAIAGSGGAGVSLSWPVADAYVLEESLSLTGPWTPVAVSIARAEFSNSTVIPFGNDTKKFFRLRSQAVTK